MNLDRYQELAMRTQNKTLDREELIAQGSMGLAGESGELIDALKKHLFHGHALDEDELIAELGDVLWYVATLSESLGFTLEKVAYKNLEKLQRRYPRGYADLRSQKRVD